MLAPRSVGAIRDQVFEPVLTASDSANAECLALPGADNHVHWSLPDPAEALHEQAQRLQFYRKGRDDLRRYLGDLLLGQQPRNQLIQPKPDRDTRL